MLPESTRNVTHFVRWVPSTYFSKIVMKQNTMGWKVFLCQSKNVFDAIIASSGTRLYTSSIYHNSQFLLDIVRILEKLFAKSISS